jgi:hypothetical protein
MIMETEAIFEPDASFGGGIGGVCDCGGGGGGTFCSCIEFHLLLCSRNLGILMAPLLGAHI